MSFFVRPTRFSEGKPGDFVLILEVALSGLFPQFFCLTLGQLSSITQRELLN